ncbi:MAG: cytochrome c-type biogenesis protein CcmH [Gemmatimonadaceae bacterium]
MSGRQTTIECRAILSAKSISRRKFLLTIPAIGLAGAAVPRRILGAQAAVQTFNGPMADAQDVYRPVTLAAISTTASMSDAQRDDLEHQIHCQCGCNLDVYTCRTTDFSCSVSPAMHADVMGLVAGGHSAREILAAFKAVYGEKVLMAPVKSGFNMLGYTMPFVALLAGGAVVAVLIRRWSLRAPVVATPTIRAVDATEGELAAIDAAVKRDA